MLERFFPDEYVDSAYGIPFEDVCQMGDDIVLVRLREEPPRPQK